MAVSSTVRIMISSRCNDPFPSGVGGARSLSQIRKDLKSELEASTLLGLATFEVWINEEAPPKGGTWDSWDVCLEAVKDCDIMVVLSNGHAGWAKSAGDIGICHAEIMTGLGRAPGKVRFIDLGNVKPDSTEQGRRNRRFQDYLAAQSLFRGAVVKTENDLMQRVREAVHDALLELARVGVREASAGKYHSGQALDWSRMDFLRRRDRMVQVVREALVNQAQGRDEAGHIFLTLGGSDILFRPHAIPAAVSVGAAKELVGQPFLRDHDLTTVLKGKRGGPVHVVACHKGVTEAAALRMLGISDATVVSAPFGIFVADGIQKVQIALLRDCRDEASTMHGVQRFIEWLAQTGEGDLLARRAAARSRILMAVAREC